jgi:hypothetical protein
MIPTIKSMMTDSGVNISKKGCLRIISKN